MFIVFQCSFIIRQMGRILSVEKKDWFCSSLKKKGKKLKSLSIETKIRMPNNTENEGVLLSQC